jgi:hypothetical protein
MVAKPVYLTVLGLQLKVGLFAGVPRREQYAAMKHGGLANKDDVIRKVKTNGGF